MNGPADPWATYWSSEGAGERGCLPNGSDALAAVQSDLWQAFARRLPQRARVLDLATGNGFVLRKMAQVRPDLKLTGVDSSSVLPPPSRGITLKPGVAMESLPFRDGSFDAVTSQFGYEYGHTQKIAAQVARVLKPGGVLQFVIHRRDGPLLSHNLRRREALQWAIAPGGYLQKALGLAAARARIAIATPAAFRQAPAEAARRFPDQSVAGELATAIVQSLELGRSLGPREAMQALNTLDQKARNEIGRIDLLEQAAHDAVQLERLRFELFDRGIAAKQPQPFRADEKAHAFAWLVSGTKNGA